MARQSKAEQDSNEEQSRARQGKAEQNRARRGKTEQDKSNAEQNRARQSTAEHNKAKKSKTEQDRAKQSKSQSKAKQSKIANDLAVQHGAERARLSHRGCNMGASIGMMPGRSGQGARQRTRAKAQNKSKQWGIFLEASIAQLVRA